jgi:hypothetical protein
LGVPLLWLISEMKRAGMHVRKHAPNRHPSKVFDKLAANYVTLEAEAVRLDLRSDTLRNIIRRYVPGRRNNRYALNPGQADDALQLAVAGGFVRRLGYATVTRSRRVANSGGRAHRGAGGVQAVGVSSGP